MVRVLLFSNLRNHFPLLTILVFGIAITLLVPLLIPKQSLGKKGSDCCKWDGVTCDWVTSHVIELDLSSSWLFSTIHSNTTLFPLPHLQRLNLAFNNFSGSSVSAEFGRFLSLTHLNLYNSAFLGLISPKISHLSNLVSFDLSWNSNTEFAA